MTHDQFIILRERVRIMRDRTKNEVTFLLEEKARGNLTEDCGETGLYHQQTFLADLERALEGSE